MISSDALGPGGREVRCGKCHQRWFQAGERDSLDELAEQSFGADLGTEIDTEKDPDDLEIQFTPHIEPSFPSSFQQPKVTIDEKPVAVVSEKTAAQHVAGIMVAVAVISVFAYGFFAAKETLVRSFPFLETTYYSLGFAAPKGSPELSFDRLKVIRSGDKAVGSGFVINLTEKTVTVPALNVELLSATRDVLATKQIQLPQKNLKAESAEKIDFSFEKMPSGAQSVRISTAP